MKFMSWVTVFALFSASMLLAAETEELPKFREGHFPKSRQVKPSDEPQTYPNKEDYELVLKPGAPRSVKIWFDELPTMRDNRLKEIEKEKSSYLLNVKADGEAQVAALRAERQSRIGALNESIAEKEREKEAVVKAPVGEVSDGRGAMGAVRRRDAAAEQRMSNRAADLRTEIGKLKRELRQLTDPKNTGQSVQDEQAVIKRTSVQMNLASEQFDHRIRLIRDNPIYVDMPALVPVDMKVNDYGFLNVSLKVMQVVDSKTILAEVEELNLDRGVEGGRVVKRDRLIWITGFDTSDIVDDDILFSTIPLAFTGTKVYDTRFGGRKKVLMMQPLDVEKWVESRAKRPGLPKIEVHLANSPV